MAILQFSKTHLPQGGKLCLHVYIGKKKRVKRCQDISQNFSSPVLKKKKKSSIVSISDKFLTVTVIIDLQPGKQN